MINSTLAHSDTGKPYDQPTGSHGESCDQPTGSHGEWGGGGGIAKIQLCIKIIIIRKINE